MGGTALWITGLPGSGKSTITDLLKEIHPDFIVLRMDDVRKIITPDPSYSDSEREIVYRSLIFIAKMLTDLGHDVIIDATGNMRKWRELARRFIPKYIEVYLKCPVDLCKEREKRRRETHGAPHDIYQKGERGWPVPGISAPYEEPLEPEIVVETGSTGVKDAVAIINDFLIRKLPRSS